MEVPARTIAGGAADDEALHEVGLDHASPERAGGGERADEHGVEELVEVPLVREEVVHRREAVTQLEAEAGAGARTRTKADGDAEHAR